MERDEGIEHRILLRNALRLGAASHARNEEDLELAIRERLEELGFQETTRCLHCRRSIPELGLCPYCSAPTVSGEGRPEAGEGVAVQKSAGEYVGAHVSFSSVMHQMLQPYFWLVVLLAAAPMVLSLLGLSEKWMFVYFSFLWAYVFFKLTGVSPSLWKPGLAGYVFTGIFALPLLVAWISMPPHITESLIASQNPLARLVGFTFGVGIREELTKVLAVMWMATFRIGGRPVLRRAGDALVVGAMCGLGFAAIENMDYLERFQFLDRVHYTFGLYHDNLSFRGTMSRVMMTPFVHGVWAGIFGYFVVLGLQTRGRGRLYLLGAGLAISAGLHGLYNFFASIPNSDFLVLLVVAVSFAVWLSCHQAGRDDGRGNSTHLSPGE